MTNIAACTAGRKGPRRPDATTLTFRQIDGLAATLEALGLAEAQQALSPAVAVVTGVLVGSGGWWVIFAGVVSRLRERLSGGLLAWINRISGAVLTVFGLWTVAGVLVRWRLASG